ncbi:hypothetical protein LZK73_15215 [Neorhizobium galegae]|nr:hypothetical protein LZK73_15215 [Neorhizobium galegae]
MKLDDSNGLQMSFEIIPRYPEAVAARQSNLQNQVSKLQNLASGYIRKVAPGYTAALQRLNREMVGPEGGEEIHSLAL